MTVGGSILTVIVAFAVTAVLTPLFRSVALLIGWEHRPDPKKWKRNANPHSVRIALGGGLTMFVGIIVSALVCSAVLLSPSQHQLLFISLLFAACALLLGLYDDWRSPRPVVRLAFQAILGVLTVSLLGWVKGLPALLAIPITVFGVVGLMNSVNMMDNMDGVASGLMTLTMIGYALLGILTRNETVTSLSLMVVGATFGFWLYNRPPALIFMGDTGSLMLGYLLAVIGTISTWGEFHHWFGQLFAPLLLASVFITDTTFVVLWRWWHGLPVMQGDRNHTSHRLAVWLGHSEWRANFVLYAVQLFMNALAIVVATAEFPIALIAALLGFGGLIALGWRLWHVQMDSQSPQT
jgi:UDP-GlcNAc:undecaprenyl-phosphate GlcNAc-1-phosphate transferase